MSQADLAHYRDLCAMREQTIETLQDRLRQAAEALLADEASLEWCSDCGEHTKTDYSITVHRRHDCDEEGVYRCQKCGTRREEQ